MKPKRCKACDSSFTPVRPMMSVCGPLCALKLVRTKRERDEAKAKKVERAQDKAKLAKLAPLSNFAARAEHAVNAYVRARDRRAHLGCISCDKPWNWDGRWNASHFRSVGAASGVRFNLWNIHSACWICNQLYSGRIDQYEPVLVQRIGQEKVDWLKAQNEPRRYTREYLERMRAIFAKKLRRLERRIRSAGDV